MYPPVVLVEVVTVGATVVVTPTEHNCPVVTLYPTADAQPAGYVVTVCGAGVFDIVKVTWAAAECPEESVAVTVNTCVPRSFTVGTQTKTPEDAPRLAEVMLEPLKASVIVKVVAAVNPIGCAVKVTAAPGMIVELGDGVLILTEAPPFSLTVTTVLAFAVCPVESVAVIVIVCVPVSPLVGVQLKAPVEVFKSSGDIVLPDAELSVTENVGLLKPVAVVVKLTF